MDDFLHEQPSPGSDGCIVVGRWKDGTTPAVFGRRVLWLVDAVGTAGSGRPPGAVTVLPVDKPVGGQLETEIDDFLHQLPKALPSLYVTRRIPKGHAAGYAAAIDAVAACMESHRRARATRQADAFAWQSHLFQNTADYAVRRLPDAWAGALTGLPAFVCGAGPSLDASADALAREAGNGVVFAADSALRALWRRGVQADFTVSVDVAKTPAKCLSERMVPERVILAATSPPEWQAAVGRDQRFYVSSNQLTLDWYNELGIARTKVTVHENCGATASELARFLGCAPIYLFGMDLALDNSGAVRRHHGDAADAAAYAGSGFHDEQEFPRVPGNFAESVPTHVIGDWRALDRRLAAWPAGLVRVVTDRGARLSNTLLVRPDEFVLSNKGLSDKADRLHGLAALGPALAPAGIVVRKLTGFGEILAGLVPAIQASLQAGHCGLVVDRLRALFAEPQNGQMLGAYALKLLPHLLPPVDEDIAFWQAIVTELGALGQHATEAASTLQTLLSQG